MKEKIEWSDEGTKVQITLTYDQAEVLWGVMHGVDTEDPDYTNITLQFQNLLDEYLNT